MNDDMQWLREYAEGGSQDAFAEIVRRHAGLVYSAALRQTANPHLAEEISQAVFLILARKAPSLDPKTVLAGWLFRTTRFVAARALRAERRRQHHEQEAATMQSNAPADEPGWDDVAPLLDDALAALGEVDRNALLLRFLERQELKVVAQAIGRTEEAAKKRVTRALEKVRAHLLRRGVTISGTALAGTLFAHGASGMPNPLIEAIVSGILPALGGQSTPLLVKTTLKAMLHLKLQNAALISAFALAVAAGGTLLAQKASDRTEAPVAPPPVAGTTNLFDRTTPLGALRDLADALEQSDTNRVLAAIQAETPQAREVLAAMSEALAAEREFKDALATRFGPRPVKIVQINFGQSALKRGQVGPEAVSYSGPDRALVQIPSSSNPDKPHRVRLVRVGSIWKLSEEDTPGLGDGPGQSSRVFRLLAARIREARDEIVDGKYSSFREAAAGLAQKFGNGARP